MTTKTTTKILQIPGSLLLLVLGACTPAPDDEPVPNADELEAEEAEAAEAAEALDDELAGAYLPIANPGPTAPDPDRERNDQLRASSCSQELHPTPPLDLASRELARGLVDPRFRVAEDQEQAARAALEQRDVEGRHFPPLATDAATLDAQARYLAAAEALAAEGLDSPQALAEAKALEKAHAFGEAADADDRE